MSATTTAAPAGFNCALSDEQQMLRDTARQVAQEQFAPKAAHYDHTGEFPHDNVRIMAQNEFFGVPFPTEYGGVGADYLSYSLIEEEIARACASTGVIYSVQISLASMPVFHFGNEEQKQRFLVPMIKGDKLGAFALSEPSNGSDAAAGRTSATDDGDHWILNGTKNFITNAIVGDLYVVFANTNFDLGHKGMIAIVVEKGTPGFTFGKLEDKMGIKASSTSELHFENCRVPKANQLGEIGHGFKIALHTLDGGRIGIASQALGIAQASLDLAKKYSQERTAFGKPISDKQAIQFMLADMATQIEAARLLTWRAAWLKDQGLKYNKEAAMAKLYASETAMSVTTKGVQILGGYGYLKDFPAERYMRDAKITEIYEGTSEIQRLVIAANVLKGG
jgi:butyryl-CoA dehydrogenase